MKEIVLDGLRMQGKDAAHAYIKRTLDFPDYYGENLDALYDCLMDIGQETCILLAHTDTLETALGTYGIKLLQTFADAAADNPSLEVEVQN